MPIDEPAILTVERQQTAVIHLTIPREECPTVFGPAVAELMAVLSEQGISPTGPLFSHHWKRPTEIFDFEVGVPVDKPVQATGRVTASELVATTIARTTYQGPYEGLGDAWGSFHDWIVANGHRPQDNLWECYVVASHMTDDASQYRTELNKPLLISHRSI